MEALQINDLDAFIATLVKQVALEIAKTRPQLPLDVQLWDATQCAEFLHMARRYFTGTIAKQVSFPTPIRVPTKDSRATPVWQATEVIAWARSWKLEVSH
ncbi:MAG: hypothetical protein V7677_10420 [Motiliproteus sp.]